jgi:hypothetical protein
MKKDLEIPRPSEMAVKKCTDIWNSKEIYISSEKSLKKLFTKTYPKNNELEDVLVKVCALDVLYSAGAGRWSLAVAKHIVDLKIDNDIEREDLEIVNKVALVNVADDRVINFYAFATKYCNYHNPIFYPIFDSYVEKMLMYFKSKDKFFDFSRDDLRTFKSFKDILFNFKKYYKLEPFNLKEIDNYLWLTGKEYFK